jgi:hypothetical protein
MKKNIIHWGIIAVCVICIIGLNYKRWLQSRTIDAYSQILSIERNFIEIEDQLRDLRNREMLTLQSIGVKIPKINNRQTNNEPKIYLRLHQGICMSCYINSIIEIYSSLSESFPVLIVGSYQYQSAYDDILRDSKLTDKDHLNEVSILNRIPADSADAPYVFTIDESGGIGNILFLDKSILDQGKVEAYMRIVNK